MDSADVDSINLALLALRCGVGAVMLAHGINHVFGGGRIAGTARWFASLGMKPGIVHAWVASATEIGAGVLLLVGLLTPLAAAGVVGVMVVAWLTNHRGNGFFIFRPGGGWEYVMTLTFVGVAGGTRGAGSWSLDEAFDIRDGLVGVPGLLLTVLAGGGGAALLLAAFYRPPQEASSPS